MTQREEKGIVLVGQLPIGVFILYLNWDTVKVKLYRLAGSSHNPSGEGEVRE